jgi:hypothetical protein
LGQWINSCDREKLNGGENNPRLEIRDRKKHRVAGIISNWRRQRQILNQIQFIFIGLWAVTILLLSHAFLGVFGIASAPIQPPSAASLERPTTVLKR